MTKRQRVFIKLWTVSIVEAALLSFMAYTCIVLVMGVGA